MSIRMVSALLVICAGMASVTAQPPATVPPAGEVVKSRLDLEKADFERGVNKELKVETLKRRVPDGFASLVNGEQRAKVYQIQAEYHELIASLQARILLLEKESLEKQEEVLTPDQRITLKKFREDLTARRKAAAANTAANRRGTDTAATEGAEK